MTEMKKTRLALEIGLSFSDKKVSHVEIEGMKFYRHNYRELVRQAVKEIERAEKGAT